MFKKRINSLPIYFFENLSRYKEISHFVSTRVAGFSELPYSSLNLGFHVGDEPVKVLKNRELLALTLEVSLNHFTVAKQIHQANVSVITEELMGKGATDYQNAISATDAMVTEFPDIYLVIFLADCVPILFFDPIKKVIGVAHAGWKGTLKLIAQKSVKALQENFGSLPADIIVGIGPSIGPCCYEVGSEVIAEVDSVFQTKEGYINSSFRKSRSKEHSSNGAPGGEVGVFLKEESVNDSLDGKGHFDLWYANKTQLIQAGIHEKNIEVAKICTCCNADIFFSARHQKGKTGRFGAGIKIESST